MPYLKGVSPKARQQMKYYQNIYNNETKAADKGRFTGAGMKRPGNPFGLSDPDRLTYQLYKINKSGGVVWQPVPP